MSKKQEKEQEEELAKLLHDHYCPTRDCEMDWTNGISQYYLEMAKELLIRFSSLKSMPRLVLQNIDMAQKVAWNKVYRNK